MDKQARIQTQYLFGFLVLSLPGSLCAKFPLKPVAWFSKIFLKVLEFMLNKVGRQLIEDFF